MALTASLPVALPSRIATHVGTTQGFATQLISKRAWRPRLPIIPKQWPHAQIQHALTPASKLGNLIQRSPLGRCTPNTCVWQCKQQELHIPSMAFGCGRSPTEKVKLNIVVDLCAVHMPEHWNLVVQGAGILQTRVVSKIRCLEVCLPELFQSSLATRT